MPAKPYQPYTTDYDTLMREAKATLGDADALQSARDRDIQPYDAPDAPEPEDNSFWGRVKHFGKNVKDAIIPTDRLSDVWEGPAHAIKDPTDSLKLLVGADRDARAAQSEKANNATSLSEFLGHKAASYLPVIGPAAAHAGEQISQGDIAGGLGTTTGLLAPFLLKGLRGTSEAERPVIQHYEGPSAKGHVFPTEEAPVRPPVAARHPNDLFDTPEFKGAPTPVPEPELAPSTSPVPEAPPAPVESPLARLLKPRANATATEAARLSGRSILDSPETAIDARAFESGKGSYGASPEEAGRAQLLHRELTHMDDRWNHLTADEPPRAAPAPPPRDLPAVQESAPFSNVEPEAPVEQTTPNLSEVDDLLRGLRGNLRNIDNTPPGVEAPLPVEKSVGAGRTPAAAAPSFMDMLKASVADQEAAKEAANLAQYQADRAGHFTLPEPRAVLNDAQFADVERRVKGGARPGDLPDRRLPRGGETIDDSPLTDRFQQEYGGLMGDERGEVNLGAGLQKLGGQINDNILNPSPEKVQKLGALAQAHQAGSLLFSPLTVGRIGISNTFSALQKAAEHAADAGSMEPIKRTLSELLNVKQMGRDAVEAFKNPDTQHTRLDPGIQPAGKGIFSAGLRAVGAADTPFRKAMERAGFSDEDALSVTQQRHPKTKFGKDALQFQQGSGVARTLIPFLKSGINLGEQGMVEPVQSLRKLLSGQGAPHDVVKVALAAGAATGAYALTDHIDSLPPWAQRLSMAASGLYEVPAAIAYAIKHGPDGVKSAITALQRSIPLAEGFNPDPSALTGRIIPRSLNPDYWMGTKRETHNELEQVQAQIPGLAQLLNVKPPARVSHHAKRAAHTSR